MFTTVTQNGGCGIGRLDLDDDFLVEIFEYFFKISLLSLLLAAVSVLVVEAVVEEVVAVGLSNFSTGFRWRFFFLPFLGSL